MAADALKKIRIRLNTKTGMHCFLFIGGSFLSYQKMIRFNPENFQERTESPPSRFTASLFAKGWNSSNRMRLNVSYNVTAIKLML